VFGVSQDFKFPTVYFADKKVNKAKFNVEESYYNIKLQTLKKEVSSAYYNLIYSENKAQTYQLLDSLYQNLAHAAKRRFELGESNYLEMITAQSKQKQMQTQYKQALQEIIMNQEQLKKVVQSDSILIKKEPLTKLELNTMLNDNHIGMQYFENNKMYYKALQQQEKQNLLPDLSAEYFQGTNSTLTGNLKGYQFGVKIPILFSGNASKIKASTLAYQAIEEEQSDYKQKYVSEYNSLLAKLEQYEEAINYYQTLGDQLSKEIIKTAERSFKHGEIDFFQYIQSIENAKEIELTYLESLNNYNQTVIAINYLIL
jgi:cobalt-zinc-cadmium resistance protein CzcA